MSTENDDVANPPIQFNFNPGILKLTKREYFAAMALQGILATPTSENYSGLARKAVNLADELLETLEDK